MSNQTQQKMTILIAEDDDGHAELIRENLQESGVGNPIIRFVNGQAIWNFLSRSGPGPHRSAEAHQGGPVVTFHAGHHAHHHQRPARGGGMLRVGMQFVCRQAGQLSTVFRSAQTAGLVYHDYSSCSD